MSAVGPLLSEYRKRNRLSQLELSLLADVSSRHISFIETGRARPSRAMLMRLADVMDLPHKDSNLLLNSGGYAAAYSALDLENDAMQPVRDALGMILRNHNPYPALVMDGNYNLLMANQAQQNLMTLMAQTLRQDGELPTNNLMLALFREDMFRPMIANWEVVASHLLRRLRRQVLAYDSEPHKALYQQILALEPPDNWQQPGETGDDGPMLTIDFNLDGLTLSLFTTLSQFGTALDTGMEELLIESYFPANKASEQFFSKLIN